jgi:hypothetical protein
MQVLLAISLVTAAWDRLTRLPLQHRWTLPRQRIILPRNRDSLPRLYLLPQQLRLVARPCPLPRLCRPQAPRLLPLHRRLPLLLLATP